MSQLRLPRHCLLINSLSAHIKTFADEFGNSEFQPGQAALAKAGHIFMLDISSAMDDYFITTDKVKFNRSLVSSAMEFIQRWEDWMEVTRLPKATRVYHEFLVRFSKGAVKATRCWIIDLQK